MIGRLDLVPGTPPIRTVRGDRTPQAWRNGAGTTEIVAATDDWRVSVAAEPLSSTFSTIEGFDRIIVPIGHAELHLSDGNPRWRPRDAMGLSVHRVQPLHSLQFAGEWAPRCRVATPTRALNVMVRRGRATAVVHIGSGGPQPDSASVRLFVDLPTEAVVVVAPRSDVDETTVATASITVTIPDGADR